MLDEGGGYTRYKVILQDEYVTGQWNHGPWSEQDQLNVYNGEIFACVDFLGAFPCNFFAF